ncbi:MULTISPECIES: hypothetical protein [unclassified Bradyrhizobium]|uniref:hypothetical protein n=1 Tax=unclassified Bradyrhizobium TaxID=2631580 RepID=UPI0020B1D5CB|nr:MULTISPECIES: hypothetical protein [unclassified Bradyrhizobium]MCP3398871.1 hypothetical protein [Bradyrhizobium sp. CCGB20]MCP3407474.1 hypothetical protein [Bradyrhizobium sp. CCGB01]
MFEFTLEWAGRRSVAERAIDARAVTDQLHIREALIFPLVLLIVFLFALGIMTGAHLNGRANDALPYLVSGGMGMPMLYPASALCRRPSNLGSVPRLQQADVLALMTAD